MNDFNSVGQDQNNSSQKKARRFRRAEGLVHHKKRSHMNSFREKKFVAASAKPSYLQPRPIEIGQRRKCRQFAPASGQVCFRVRCGRR